MNLIYGISGTEGILNDENALVGRFAQSLVDIGNVECLVLDKAMHALPYHAQSLLDYLLKCAAYCHHLAHRFHRRTNLTVHAVEFSKVPARNLAHYVVECRFEECRSHLRNRVLQVEESVTKSELGCNERKRIACGFRCQCRASAEACVHLNHAVVHRLRVVGILHIALSHDSYVANYLYCEFAKQVVIVVAECLRRSHHDTLSGVDSERVEVLHVAHGDAVVIAVAHHLIFHLFPALERFLNEHLW